MANELLDFVMSVVRDPDTAARFAANPEQAILDANLTDVSAADVNALIPVVSESLSTLPTTVPTAGFDGVAEAANVWTSGAATAAFDAFGDQVPVTGLDDLAIDVPTITDPGVETPSVDDGPLLLDPAVESVIDDAPTDLPEVADLGEAVADIQQLDVDAGGFDLFD
ncbi:hypothetical protein H7J88_01315 [Mycolicibacterium flavescens]|uniref:Uncharacterized protein n=1 Tax=Mycolicibacterium flavescens TaxID=1776 RepID=A0A1E3RNR2_MYCFV|nr:IniB N-terminal domain-containing protein [Mycolicibacterium flavescens]MCV7278283.1 hypothetical protein [Mycolicibacterium flavescens]ODQ91536.1 hypothetical protein BHQ18_05480 [Mycolicibacterium flavescens]